VASGAILFDPTRPDQLAREITRIIREPERREELSELGRRRASEFTWRRSAQRHLELYREVSTHHEAASLRV